MRVYWPLLFKDIYTHRYLIKEKHIENINAHHEVAHMIVIAIVNITVAIIIMCATWWCALMFSICGWVSELVGEWVQVGEWMSEWMSECRWVSEWVSAGGWVSEWVSEWVSAGEWVQVSEWVQLGLRLGLRLGLGLGLGLVGLSVHIITHTHTHTPHTGYKNKNGTTVTLFYCLGYNDIIL